MTGRVNYSEAYKSDLDSHLAYLIESGVSRYTIDRWFTRLIEFSQGIADWPESYPVDNALTRTTGQSIRKANFGHYLISYRIEADQKTVTLLAFAHGATRRER